MNQKTNPFQTGQKPPARSHANFIEALKSVSNSTTQSIKHDVIGGVAEDFANSLVGNTKPVSEQPQDREANLAHEDQIRQEILKAQQHREVVETSIFSRREEESKTRIKVIQDELKALAKDLAGVDVQLQKAIEEEIVNPGAYHISFFEKLRKLIIDLRKRVAESATWLEAMTARSAKQKGYWGKVSQSGTKFMLSQERYMSTQAG